MFVIPPVIDAHSRTLDDRTPVPILPLEFGKSAEGCPRATRERRFE
jgi:hypothetical protein